MRPVLTVLIYITILSSQACAEDMPAVLRAALDAPRNGPFYAYDMTYDDGNVIAMGTIDASLPEGERVIVHSPPEKEWPDGFAEGLKEIDAEADGDIWCADIEESVPAEVSLLDEDMSQAIYIFTPIAGPDADRSERKLMRHLTATITVAKQDPAILAFHMWAEDSFKPMFLARINSFDMAIECTRAPDGRTYTKEMKFSITGSAMGSSFDETENISITRLLHTIDLPSPNDNGQAGEAEK